MLTIPVPIVTGSSRTGAPATAVGAGRTESTTRYPSPRRGKAVVIFAMALSAASHGLLLFGVRPSRKTPRTLSKVEAPMITLVMPQLKELEEPEPQASDEPPTKPDLGTPAPMLADIPRIPS